jgi:hypothetical protein
MKTGCHPSLMKYEMYLSVIPLDVQDHWVCSFGVDATQMLIGMARADEIARNETITAHDRLKHLNQYIADHYASLAVPWLKQKEYDTISENRQWAR